jgi:anti-sigma factor RsiW
MHNCKLTRRSFIDLALDEVSPASSLQLLAELKECPACQEEYAALRNTLHVSNRALRSALPGEGFWSGYHTRLHAKLSAVPVRQSDEEHHSPLPAQVSFGSQLWLALRAMATTSLRVPVPAVLALALLLGVSFFVLRARRQVNTTQSTPVALVETRTVEVPVIQEKVVTRVVYVEKKPRRSVNGLDRRQIQSGSPGDSAVSLVGFKPTDEIKLTIIKGSYKDEK